MPSEVLISHNIELSQQLPNDVMDIARKQGEDPDKISALIDEFKQTIYGKSCLSRAWVTRWPKSPK